ncbi:MAG: 4-(cytidine 5'-diphospho)-2-C-methyl-D-erythritol kinase, partial [Verrucomicrobia bacterium]
AAAFVAATGWGGAVRFNLEKQIPVGAGLGGGSSNAVAALHALEALSGHKLPPDQLFSIAARLGSDCPLFLWGRPLVLRGRGEVLALLPPAAEARIRGRRLLVFKPSFGVATPWAFQALAARPDWYAEGARCEASLGAWLASPSAPAEELLGNTLEKPVFEKWLALPVLLSWLRARHGVEARMSGSGSACFVLLAPEQDEAPLIATIRDAWGESTFVQPTGLA